MNMRKDRDNLLEHREVLLDAIGVALAELDLGKYREAVKTLDDARNHIEELIKIEEAEEAATKVESAEEIIWGI